MRKSLLLVVLSMLLVSSVCDAFTTSALGARSAVPRSDSGMSSLESHAMMDPEDHMIKTMESAMETTASSAAEVNSPSDSEMNAFSSIAGLCLFAVLLALSPDGSSSSDHLVIQNFQQVDEGSMVTLLVDSFFLGIAGLVSVISRGGVGDICQD